jgi:hypothetical protein
MPTDYAIDAGDCTMSVAAEAGYHDWKPVWNAPENQALRESRKSPFVLLPGDTVTVPDPRLKTVERPEMALHRFVLKTLRARLRVRLLQRHADGTQAALAGASCHVTIDEVVTDATSDSDGWVEVKLDPAARAAELKVDKTQTNPPLGWHISLGTLLPDTETSGAVNRLINLGYRALAEDSQVYLPYAIRAFQEDAGIEVTGELDDATKSELAKRHAI